MAIFWTTEGTFQYHASANSKNYQPDRNTIRPSIICNNTISPKYHCIQTPFLKGAAILSASRSYLGAVTIEVLPADSQ